MRSEWDAHVYMDGVHVKYVVWVIIALHCRHHYNHTLSFGIAGTRLREISNDLTVC